MNGKKTIVIRCNAGKRYGYGHLKRSILLANRLKSQFNVFIFVGGEEEVLKNIRYNNGVQYVPEPLKNKGPEILPGEIQLLEDHNITDPYLFILDVRDTDDNYIRELRKLAPVLTFDNFGTGTRFCDIVINALPGIKDKPIQSNFNSNEYLIIDPLVYDYKRKTLPVKINQVYVSFGGEDPYRLTEFILKNRPERLDKIEWNVILGPLYQGKRKFSKVNIIENPKNFYEELSHADLVITSFGITVYEALSMNIPVLLINPTAYHQSLSENLPEVISPGTHTRLKNSIKNILQYYLSNEGEEILHSYQGKIQNYTQIKGLDKLDSVLKEYPWVKDYKCPACSNLMPEVVMRDGLSNSYHCRVCHTFFRSPLHTHSIKYQDTYFTTDYEDQYGRTYLEDKENINKLNKKRLERLLKHTKNTKGKLIEIGSAMGFFLELARNKGFEVKGIEISRYASNYSRRDLALDVTQADFMSVAPDDETYDVVCAWYYIEHNREYLLSLLKMISLLKPGGVLALSTPNAYGLSARLNGLNYYKRIPQDHFIEFSEYGLRRLLEKTGMQVIESVQTGIHYSRILRQYPYPILVNKNYEKIYNGVAKSFKLGDTFEIYARKPH